jgi:polygalacturonase
MDGTTSGLRIKSDVSRGGLVSDIHYRNICLRDVKTPIDFDSAYDKDAVGDKYPLYQDIHLQDVHSITPGRMVLNGLDDAHRLQADFDNVVVAGKTDRQVSYADIRVLPDIAPVISCDSRFAPFPTSRLP